MTATLEQRVGIHVSSLAIALDAFLPQAAQAARWGVALADALSAGQKLLAAGNGGSAAQAQHLTAEIVGRYRDDRPPFSAIALHAEASALTAIVNDYGAEEMYARQVQAHGRPGDICVLMSTSGRSPNVVRAAERARSLGLVTWALTGRGSSPLADIADETLAVDAGETATVQEVHLVALHLICEAMDFRLDSSGPASAARDRRVHPAGATR